MSLLTSLLTRDAPPHPHGPPYPPTHAALGGTPTITVDIPLCAVFIVLFIASAALNMAILLRNKKRGHDFILSGPLFGYSMARVTANVLRIVWACYPHNINVGIASSIFLNAGVVLLFVVNLILCQRVLRAYHPQIGWAAELNLVFRFLIFSVVANFLMSVVVVIYSFFTLDHATLARIHIIQLVTAVFFTVLAFVPVLVIAFCLAKPRSPEGIEKFGTGRMRTKMRLLLFTSVLLTFGAAFRAAGLFTVRPLNDPSWLHHKAALYTVDFVLELICVFLYALSRFDKRFHVPNGSSAPGHYSGGGPPKPSVSTEEMTASITAEKESDGERSTDQFSQSAVQV